MHQLIEHKRNTAFTLVFGAELFASAGLATGLDPVPTVVAYYKDGVGAWASLALSNAIAEIAATGAYAIDLTAAELNHDYVMVAISATGVRPRVVEIRTHLLELDDLNKARQLITNNRSLDVATGVETVKDDAGTGDAYTITPGEAVAGTVTQVVADA